MIEFASRNCWISPAIQPKPLPNGVSPGIFERKNEELMKPWNFLHGLNYQ
jgi:hypothetical protein